MQLLYCKPEVAGTAVGSETVWLDVSDSQVQAIDSGIDESTSCLKYSIQLTPVVQSFFHTYAKHQ